MADDNITAGRALFLQGQFQQAAEKFGAAVKANPTDPDALNDYGAALVNLNQSDKAIEHFRKAATLWQQTDPHEQARALRNIAVALRDKGELEAAETEARAATKAWPEYSAAFWTLGLILRRRGRQQDAADAYAKAIELDPNDAARQNELGLTLAALGRHVEAAQHFERASDLWGDSIDRKFALRNWADALLALDRTHEAVAKLRQAVRADPDDAISHNALGLALAVRQDLDGAIAHYRTASELWQKAASSDRKFALRNWAAALTERGRPVDAVVQLREAVKADPKDPETYSTLGFALVGQRNFADAIANYRKAIDLWPAGSADRHNAALICADVHFRYGVELSEDGRAGDAIEQYDKAIALDADGPYPYHNKADQLFQLGDYQKGWSAWDAAFDSFNVSFKVAKARQPADVTDLERERAAYFGYMLTRVFGEYAAAERAFRFVLAGTPHSRRALCGRALLYRRWANSEDATQQIRIMAAQLMRDACEVMRPAADPDTPPRYNDLLVLANLHVVNRDFAVAMEWLDAAERAPDGPRLRRADIAIQRGVIGLGKEEYPEAVRYFRLAMLDRGDDLDLQSKLGHALLGAKQFDTARMMFRRVLGVAPGHIELLVGCAGACIALGDDGDADQYERAEQHLNEALRHGRDARSGSLYLRRYRVAEILYLRGYAKVKRWEAGAGRPRFGLLQEALSDFEQCRRENPRHDYAAAAIDKVASSRLRRIEESLANRIGPLLFLCAGLAIFVWTQLEFFFGEALRGSVHVLSARAVLSEASYITLTFGGLAFAMAGLSLPTLLRLKVAGIELQKAAPEQAVRVGGFGLARFDTSNLIDRADVTGPFADEATTTGTTAAKKPHADLVDVVTTQSV